MDQLKAMSMAKGENCGTTWKSYIIKHLGKSVARKHVGLMADIVAVDSGIKPGYLYDIGAPDPVILTNLLVDLKSGGLISTYCNVVQVGMDCMIVNVDSVKAMDVSVDSVKERLVDVSLGRASPGLCFTQTGGGSCLQHINQSEIGGKFSQQHIHQSETRGGSSQQHINQSQTGGGSSKQQINQSDANLACEQLVITLNNTIDNLDCGRIHAYSIEEPECNVSSLFGLLLGYPVLYWYDLTADHHGNCLSMETLTCMKLTVRLTNEKFGQPKSRQGLDVRHGLYSFSYPACLSYWFKSAVESWFVTVQEKIRQSEFFSEPELVEESAIFETLNL